MNKKTLFTAFLALGLALTGCGKPSEPASTSNTPNSSNTTSSSSEELTRIEGNGTDWVDSIKALLDQAYEAVGDDSIAVPYVDAKYYYAEFAHLSYLENSNYDVTGTTIIAFDSEEESIADSKRESFMNSYKDHYSELGFTIDISNYSRNRTWTASKVLHGTKMMFVQFGLQIMGTIDEYTPLYGLLISVGVQQYVSASGYIGDDLDAWPTEGFKEVVGTDILHPTYEDESKISYFGGWNVFPGTDSNGNDILLDIYVLNCIGATRTDYANYIKALEDAGYEMLTDDETNEVYGAYDFLTGTLIQFAYSTQSGYEGIVIFAFLASEPFKKSDTLPYFASSLPEYTEEDKTFVYYYTSRTISSAQTGTFTLHTILIPGVSDNACETYKTILEANGFTVQYGEDSNGNVDKSFYVAQNTTTNVFLKFYLDTYPTIGQSLTIGLFEF